MRIRYASALFLTFLMVPVHLAQAEEEIGELLKEVSKDRSLRDSTVHALVKAMEENPSDPSVPRAFAWLIYNANVSEGSEFDMSDAFFQRIVKHHADNDQMATGIGAMIGFREKPALAFLEQMGDSKSDIVAGSALLALASSFEHDDQQIERYDKTLKKMIKNYPDLKTGRRDLTAYAKQKLYASENLRIGKAAPEVEGEDADGKKFKLSDYKGKVVFFNFWGDW